MSFVQPNFNLAVNIWRAGSDPLTDPPDVTAVGNLSPGRIVSDTTPTDAFGVAIFGHMWLRLPANTDIQDLKNGIAGDHVECPAGTGRYYDVQRVDDIGGGFPNEHRFALLSNPGFSTWPTPFPGCGAIPIVPGSHFLLETSGGILLETTGFLLLE